MWQAGFAVTDPGYSFYHPEIQMMDPGPEDRLGIMMKLARALDANRCDERCRVRAPHPAARDARTSRDAASMTKSVVLSCRSSRIKQTTIFVRKRRPFELVGKPAAPSLSLQVA